MDSSQKIRIALVGQPNVGKSTVFNMLTGLNQHVGNWPGKTVEFKIGHLDYENSQIELIDLPGIYSLTANSEEERVARNFIIQEKPDLVIVIVNAANLERNLYIVTELIALDVPIVIGLNMLDVAGRQGFKIDVKVLQAALNIPVVPLIASRNQGIRELINVAKDLAQDPSSYAPNRPEIDSRYGQVVLDLSHLIKDCIEPSFPVDWVALKLLEGDQEAFEKVREACPQKWPEIEEILKHHEDAILEITSARYEWIARMEHAAIVRPRVGRIVLTDRIDRFATHPFWGIILLFAVFGLVFFTTFKIATPIVEWMQLQLVLPAANFMAEALTNAPAWFTGLIVDGIIGGVGMVLTFLPILILFFTVLGALEDVGYLARAAFVMDRFMHLMGLHGRSFLSLFLGFGCNVPAVMGTRIIEDKRARILTILLIPLVPCTARLAVVTFLAPAFFGRQATLVTWLLVVVNLVILMLVGISINRFVYKGQYSPFIMEIPLYHLPNLRTIGLYVWNNTLAFIKKAGGLIVIFAVIVWALSWFPNGNLSTSLLAQTGRYLEPFGRLMGITDWRLIVSLITSFIAKENTIATLGILFSAREQSQILSARIASAISPAGGLSFLLVQMLFIPCVATLAVIKQETKSWKITLLSVFLLVVISLSVGVGVYQAARLFGWGV